MSCYYSFLHTRRGNYSGQYLKLGFYRKLKVAGVSEEDETLYSDLIPPKSIILHKLYYLLRLLYYCNSAINNTRPEIPFTK